MIHNDDLNLSGMHGGVKQHFNRVNSELIRQFTGTMGWEKTKEVFKVTDQTLASIFVRAGTEPPIKREDQIKLNQSNLEDRIFEVIRESREHKNQHESSRELLRVAFDIVEKIVMPIVKTAIEYTGEKEDNESHQL